MVIKTFTIAPCILKYNKIILGICPKPECNGMELIKKEPEDALNMVLQPVNLSVLSTVKTIHPEKKEIPITIEAQGYIDYDDRAKQSISSSLDGRIEKLYVRYNFQPIHKGQKIFDIYSPELVTAQQNLLFLLSTDKDATDLVDAAKQRLKILGMNEAQIATLVTSHKVQNNISVYSKWDGHIHETQPITQSDISNSDQSMAMSEGNSKGALQQGNNQTVQTTSSLSIKEGMYVSRGQTVFNVIDQNRVVAKLQIKGQNISKIKVYQKVAIEIEGSSNIYIDGRINFINPLLKQNERTLLARVDIDNGEKKFKVGSLVKSHISVEAVEGLWVPASAVIDLGKNKIVWVKRDRNFVAQKVELGVITNEWIEITDGVKPRDEIAVEGYYLTDSEGFIKTIENEE